jgi:hypothetical protein
MDAWVKPKGYNRVVCCVEEMHGLSPKGITGLFVVLRRCMG